MSKTTAPPQQPPAMEHKPLEQRQIAALYFEALGSQHPGHAGDGFAERFARAIEHAHGIGTQ